MKVISVKLPDDAFEAIDQAARSRNKTAEEVVVEAVERWRESETGGGKSILSMAPVDLGLMKASVNDDLLGEMLDDSRD